MVSIPSQMGTVFGPTPRPPSISTTIRLNTLNRLNTLTGGHCIRTAPAPASPANPPRVSIPSQVGTVFGRDDGYIASMHTARSQYPHRWALYSDGVLSGSELGVCPSQYPHRWALYSDPAPARSSAPAAASQYPHRWALYSDKKFAWLTSLAPLSQYPHRWALYSDRTAGARSTAPGARLNTLTGGHCIRTQGWTVVQPDGTVSIPSQVGTVFGRLFASRWLPPSPVSIPSQVGTVFGPRTMASSSRLLMCLNTLTGGHCIRTKSTVAGRVARPGLNTLTGGHCIRTRLGHGLLRAARFRLNTLTGGHCIRTTRLRD